MLLFFDTETTGLPTRRGASASDVRVWPRVVQIAWILTDRSGRRRESANYIIKPAGYVIPDEAARIHGITTSRARADGSRISLVLKEFEAAVRKCSVVVAHNTDFDLNVITAELIRRRVPTHIGRKGSVCTMTAGTDFCQLPGGRYGQYKWPTLAELHRRLFGRTPRLLHNAAWDVRACMRSYFELQRLGLLPEAFDDDIDDPRELIDEILELSADRDWFDTAFVEDVAAQLEDRGNITTNQHESLIRIRDMLANAA